MATTLPVAIGIDTASASHAFTVAAIDAELGVLRLDEAEFDGLIAFLRAQPRVVVGVNAPSHVNSGVMRKRLERGAPGAIRGAELREAEHDLHLKGIAVSGTPRAEAQCPSWMQLGFSLYRELSKAGYRPFPSGKSECQWVETHPQAAFCVLLGKIPLSKPSLEGRLQRALVLFERGLGIRDPMSFLEEVTRHRLLNGQLPTDLIPTLAQLDALVAAYTAWMAISAPNTVTRVGNQQEGYIVLPAAELLVSYKSDVERP